MSQVVVQDSQNTATPSDFATVSSIESKPQIGGIVTNAMPKGQRPFRTGPFIKKIAATVNVSISKDALAANDERDTAIAGTNDGRIIRTSDGGNTWQWSWLPDADPQITSFQSAVFLGHQNSFLISDSQGRSFLTDDGGKSWRRLAVKFDSELKRLASNQNGTVIAMTAEGSLFRASSGNYSNWVEVVSPSTIGLVDACFIAGSSVAAGFDKFGMLWRSLDDGETWEKHETRYAVSMRSISCEGHTLIAIGQYDGTHPFKLVRVVRGVPQPTQYASLLNIDYVTGEVTINLLTGILVRSDDNGATWSVLANTSFPIAAIGYDSLNHRHLVVGATGYLIGDDSNGAWRSLQAPGSADLVGITVGGSDGEATALSDDGTIFSSTDGGENWGIVGSERTKANSIVALKNTVIAYGDLMSIIANSDDSVPRVVGVRAVERIGSNLNIDIQLDDPSNQCGKDCVEVLGWSEADYAKRAELAPRPIPSNLISRPEHHIVRISINPALALSAQENSNIYLAVKVHGSGFNLIFPTRNAGYEIRFNPDWRLLVFASTLFGLCLSVGFVYVFRPVWIIALLCHGERISNAIEVPIVQPAIRAIFTILLSPMVFRRRVLNSWAKQHQGQFLARLNLDSPPEFDYVSLPFKLRLGHSGSILTVDGATGEELRRVISRTHPVVVISGAGGTGKSALASQIARLATANGTLDRWVLPVWIAVDESAPKQIPDRIREIAEVPWLPDSIVERLSKGRYLLFVVDGVSEAPSESQTLWREFVKRSVFSVVTTRNLAPYSSREYAYISTANLNPYYAAALLTGTVTSLLRARGAGTAVLSIQASLLTGFARLIGDSEVVSPLLVRLFAESYVQRAVDAIDRSDGDGQVPSIEVGLSSIQVYFDYLAEMHKRGQSGNAAIENDAELFIVCKTLAVRELEGDYQPKAIDFDDGVLSIQASLQCDRHVASAAIYRLTNDGILRMFSFEGNVMWRFEFDPVAEHLAARSIIDEDALRAKELLRQLGEQDNTPQGFVEAAWSIFDAPGLTSDSRS